MPSRSPLGTPAQGLPPQSYAGQAQLPLSLGITLLPGKAHRQGLADAGDTKAWPNFSWQEEHWARNPETRTPLGCLLHLAHGHLTSLCLVFFICEIQRLPRPSRCCKWSPTGQTEPQSLVWSLPSLRKKKMDSLIVLKLDVQV